MQEDNHQDQPGTVIGPSSTHQEVVIPIDRAATPVAAAPQPSVPAPALVVAQAQPAPVTPPAPLPEPLPPVQMAPQPVEPDPTPFVPAAFTPDQLQPQPMQPAPQSSQPAQTGDGVSWSASEYIANVKNSGWFVILGTGTVILSVVVYLITKDILSIVAIVVLGIVVGVFAARQPQVLNYRVDRQGIQIGDKFYAYTAFKSFSVVTEHAMGYISLLPLKRFMPPLAIHYAPDDEEKIVDTLGDYLPYEEHKPDLVEGLSRRVRF